MKAATAVAQAPVPQAWVIPEPLSHTLIRIVSLQTICANSTLVLSGKRWWFSNSGPISGKLIWVISSTKVTRWGFPIDTLVDRKGYLSSKWTSPVSNGLPISTVTAVTVFPSTWSFRILIPDSVSRVISVLSVKPYSYTYLPTQRLPLPHIIASEPSALKIRILKSALSEFPINISPSLPIPVWNLLHSIAFFSGAAIG